MKILLLLASLAAVTCQAQNIHTVTTVVLHGSVTNSVGGRDLIHATNVVAIPNGQAARVAMVLTGDDAFRCVKAGATWNAQVGHVVAGPAEFIVTAYGLEPSVVTLERWTVKRSK